MIDFGWGNLIILVDFILFLFSPESLRGRLLMKKERKKSRPVVGLLKWNMDLPCDRDPSPILISTRWLRPKSEWVSLFHDASQLPFLTASTIGWKTGIPRAVIKEAIPFLAQEGL
ncbi:hypothetical protein DN752_21965 [Echinicola strongylocentroti]|uniref:Uncharacterized protein n=1 Tax=Echinicola strongylocentroti TaxID=1795355 RepID=A0A2Z4IP77_9BACT|nr:hypothetical protein DN752_21965 [Echinicola strongylocentroti]